LLVSRASQLRVCVSNAPVADSMAASIHHGKVVVAICRLRRGLPALRPRLGMDPPAPSRATQRQRGRWSQRPGRSRRPGTDGCL
jgi:hypothetical protein